METRIFDVRIDNMDRADALRIASESIRSGEQVVITHVHVMGLNIAYKTPWLREFWNHSGVVYCDGMGVRLGARLLGQPLPPRYTLADWYDELVKMCSDNGYRLFLLGNPPGVAGAAAANLSEAYPGLQIAGSHTGFFDMGGPENEQLLEQLKTARPDILLVGMGMPRQEQWVRDNLSCLDVPVIWTVGGLFEYIAKTRGRANKLLTDHYLEWFTRLLADPARYWKRYLVGNPLFLFRVLRQRFSGKTGA